MPKYYEVNLIFSIFVANYGFNIYEEAIPRLSF